jgi:hypothetical protein
MNFKDLVEFRHNFTLKKTRAADSKRERERAFVQRFHSQRRQNQLLYGLFV